MRSDLTPSQLFAISFQFDRQNLGVSRILHTARHVYTTQWAMAHAAMFGPLTPRHKKHAVYGDDDMPLSGKPLGTRLRLGPVGAAV